MVQKKRQSKRLSLKKKYRIEKNVRDHHRKLRKEARKHPERKRLKKDPGIPNLWPFKEQMLEQMKEQKEQLLKEKERQREQLKTKSSIAQNAKLSLDAAQKSAEFESREQVRAHLQKSGAKDLVSTASRRRYLRELRKVTEASQVIIEVLDARDPLGCRCPDLENMILAADSSKRIVLLLNKVDLVPREVAQGWIDFFSSDYPTLAFKSNTQEQRSRLHRGHQSAIRPDSASTSSSSGKSHSKECLGASELMTLLRKLSTTEQGARTTISVGVIGYPNVGKSSVINSLKRSRAANVGNKPGVTKNMQEIYLDQHIRLLDSPGIVFSSSSDQSELVLRNVVRLEDLDDTVGPVEVILRRCNWQRLMNHYEIGSFHDVEEFLAHIARRHGKFKQGGVPNIQIAGRMVLQDWNSGKIPYFTIPPVMPSEMESNSLFQARNVAAESSSSVSSSSSSSQFVDSFAPEFDITALTRDVLATLPSLNPSNDSYVTLESGAVGAFDVEDFHAQTASFMQHAGMKRSVDDDSDIDEEAIDVDE